MYMDWERGGRSPEECSRQQRAILDLLKGLVVTPITTGLNFALLAPPGAGKTTICQSLLKEPSKQAEMSLRHNKQSSFADQRTDPSYGTSAGRADQIIYVDMYSWLLGERSQERFQIDNASDVASVSVYCQVPQRQPATDPLLSSTHYQTLLSYNSEDFPYVFMSHT